MTAKRQSLFNKILAVITDVIDQPDHVDVSERLHDVGFSVSPGVARSLKSLVAGLGADPDVHRQLATVLADLSKSPGPTGALVSLFRYVEATGGTNVLLNTVAGGKPIREILASVFGASQYMSEIIIRNPGYLYWLIEKQTWDREDTKGTYLSDLRSDAANFQSIEGKLNAVRRFQRRALLKIGVHDLLGLRTIEETTLSLSHLADAITGGLLEILREHTPDLDREPADTGFAVLALGKLGGEELNYSSDIDLIYVCDDADEETIERHRKLAEELTSALSEVTAEGYLYRVDLRLRPDGHAGPLVNPISSMMIYYENRGRPWEFQAMLKARTIAGDMALGERILRAVAGLVFSPSLSYSPLDAIAIMRQRIRENISTRDRAFNIKLMEGGIRDIEFIVQALQLMHGGKHPDLRSTNTVTGIETGHQKKLLKNIERKMLLDAYRFFRLVEHRLQMMHQIKAHSIPESSEEINFLAKRVSLGPLGRFTGERFLSTLTTYITKIRLLSDSFFAQEDIPDASLLVLLPEDDVLTEQTLSSFNFSDTRHASSVLRSLAHGSFPHLVDRKTRASFQKLLPSLLKDAAMTGDPNQTLVNFAALADSARNPSAFYDSLNESLPFRMLVRDLTGSSPVLTKKLAGSFDGIDSLRKSPLAVIDSPLPDGKLWRAIMADSRGGNEAAYNQIRGAMDRRTLAAWIADIDGGDFPKMLFRTVAATVRGIATSACDALFGDRRDVVIFALGSFGVSEPRLTSDLDLLVVARGGDLEPITRDIHTLNGVTERANLFKLDFRLRGEGANAPLVQDIESYKRYFEKRMSPWEKIAFAKCGHWYGDPSLASEFVDALVPHLTKVPDRRAIESLTQTRDSLETLVPTGADRLETKRSKGGRYDIDYLCAIGLALSGDRFPLDASTSDRLGWIVDADLISSDDLGMIEDALTLFQRVDYLLELAGVTLPKTPEQMGRIVDYLDRTLTLLGMESEGGVDEALRRYKAAVRECYTEVLTKAG
jgi:glutamate-ammonia-ligase adenylyltransferase